MTDYYPLIARAVEGLAKNTGEARRTLYERARAALVAQLRGVEPALTESDITKERLALEEAIRKVEAEASRKTLAEPRNPARAEPRPAPAAAAASDAAATPQPAQDEGAAPAAAAQAPGKPSARARILGARTASLTQTGLKGFRTVVSEVDGLGAATAKAAQTARDTRDTYVPVSRPRVSQAEDLDAAAPSAREPTAPHYEDREFHPAGDEPHEQHGLEPAYGSADEDAFAEDDRPASRALRPRPTHFEDEDYEEPRPPRSYGRWIRLVVLLLIVAAVAGAGFHYRSNIAGVYQFFAQMKSRPAAPTNAQDASNAQPNAQPKFDGRVPQEASPGQAPAGSPNAQAGPAVAQRAVLYEADPNDPQGKRFAGSVVWRTETVSPGPGLAPELVVRGDVSIPERHLTVTWSLRRNTDKALPASHTIEVMFNLPPDFAGGGIANVPGILMKDSEEVRGTPLAGLAVKVTNGFFLIGLNAADPEMQHNVQLLKERPWFDILIVYNNNSRAILTMEKGPPGERAFADAFKAWGQ
jgi:hypothetical protein